MSAIEEIVVVTPREQVGKAASRELRKAGMIPATVYGLNESVLSVSVSPKVVARVLASDAGMNSLVQIEVEGQGKKSHVIIKDLQRNPVTGRLSHVDFMRVDPTHKVRVHVPIVLRGTPAGVKEGGILDFVHRQIEVECLPAHIPGHIDVSVATMKVGDSIRLDQITLDAHLTVIGDAHNVICAVHGLAAEAETAAPAAADAAAAPAADAKAKK
ncbi:MAG TPA: 50S ribosomal protein L25 [Holophaga sp.]|jgi:large subunit ribosomal protein L25|nr:50S ribosomal protein L25 [Holophaga sp.]